MTADLFADLVADLPPGGHEAIGAQAHVLRGFAQPQATALLAAVDDVLRHAPWRHQVTPGGFTMSVASTNCGALGWTSDRRGYRYTAADPLTGHPWPPLPALLSQLAREAADAAGFAGFEPDACLVNRYAPRTRLSLHQDHDERDLAAPIVSVSLGMAATFLFGGLARTDPVARIALVHGDVVVWGGVDRLRFHGVAPLAERPHPQLGAQRINLTFRKAG